MPNFVQRVIAKVSETVVSQMELKQFRLLLDTISSTAAAGNVTIIDPIGGLGGVQVEIVDSVAVDADVTDRAARLLGIVYGSQGQPLQQKAVSFELLTDVVDRAARDLGRVDIADELPAGTQQIGQVGVLTDNGAGAYQNWPVNVALTPEVDVEDRAARDLGRVDIADELPAGTQHIGQVGVKTDNGVGGYQDWPVNAAQTPEVDVADRAARDLGQVDIADALPVGANIIGKVGIDQTTPGTTNAVVPLIDNGAGGYADWGVRAGGVPRVSHSNGAQDMPVGDALARRIYTNICDGSLEAAVKADGATVGNALVVVPGKYEIDPAVATANRMYYQRLAQHKFIVRETPGGHFLEAGRAFGAANAAYISCDTAGGGVFTWYPFMLRAEGARAGRVKYLGISVSALSLEPADVWIFLQPTINNVGNPLTETNRQAGSATVNTVQAYDSPLIAVDGSLVLFRHVPIGGSWEVSEEDLSELKAGQGTLLVKAISSDLNLMGFPADVAVGCMWWEEL